MSTTDILGAIAFGVGGVCVIGLMIWGGIRVARKNISHSTPKKVLWVVPIDSPPKSDEDTPKPEA